MSGESEGSGSQWANEDGQGEGHVTFVSPLS